MSFTTETEPFGQHGSVTTSPVGEVAGRPRARTHECEFLLGTGIVGLIGYTLHRKHDA